MKDKKTITIRRKEEKRVDFSDLDKAKENVAENMRLIRETYGLSQNKMAEILGFKTPTAISLMESGDRNISIETLWKLSRLADVSVKQLFMKNSPDFMGQFGKRK